MNTKTTDSQWVWTETTPAARITSVYFRRELSIENKINDAQLHLFAHSRYHLRVNGHRVGVGPVRSYPKCPEFDSYDLTPHLRTGNNIIAVHVVHIADESYHQLPLQGLFITWGSIQMDNEESIDLSTPGDWLCQRSQARDEMAPRFSFAIGSLDVMDLRKENGEWWQEKCPNGSWTAPVPLEDGILWGALKPRSTPSLIREFKPTETILGIYEHETDESMLSFRLSQENKLNEPYALAYSYIHSPCAQDITMGTWWGEYYINGEYINQSPDPDNRSFRMQAIVSLKNGWNLFCVGYGLLDNIWEFHLTYLKSANLIFSAEKVFGNSSSVSPDKPTFKTCQPVEKSSLPDIDSNFHPTTLKAIESHGIKWQSQAVHTEACSPLRSLAWPRFTPSLSKVQQSITTLHANANTPTSFILDCGRIQLGQIIFTYKAPEGTCINIGYAEELKGDRPAYDKNIQVMAGERRWCKQGKHEIEFFFPRGFRYLHIAVSQHTEDVTIESVGVLCQRYPYNFTGEFECSDKAWTRLWHAGVRTLDLCSEDVITDCPWRERTLYGGDLLPEAATAFAVTGDTTLVRHSLDIFVQSYTQETHWLQSMAPKVANDNNMTLFDYPLLVIHLCNWYFRYSGDLDFVKQCIPVFRDMMHTLRNWRDPDGSWRIPPDFAAFIDWTEMDNSGNLCSLNALIARVFKDYAELLMVAGINKEESAEFEELGNKTATMLSSKYWDSRANAFADRLNDDGTFGGDHYIASSSWPSVFGFCDEETNKSVAAHIEKTMKRFDPRNDHATTSTYGAFYYLGALYQMNEEALAEKCIHTQYQLMIESDAETIWEHSHDEKSLVHAWSTAPTYYGSTRILGVRLGWPEHDNIDEILIAPQASSITWACGTVMHPKGPVSVDWKLIDGKLHLAYKAPEEIKVTVTPQGILATYPIVMQDWNRR